MRKVWTADETERLVREMLSGKTYQELADEFGVAYWQVCGKVNTLRQNGVNIPYAPENRRRVDYKKLKDIVNQRVATHPTTNNNE